MLIKKNLKIVHYTKIRSFFGLQYPTYLIVKYVHYQHFALLYNNGKIQCSPLLYNLKQLENQCVLGL